MSCVDRTPSPAIRFATTSRGSRLIWLVRVLISALHEAMKMRRAALMNRPFGGE